MCLVSVSDKSFSALECVCMWENAAVITADSMREFPQFSLEPHSVIRALHLCVCPALQTLPRLRQHTMSTLQCSGKLENLTCVYCFFFPAWVQQVVSPVHAQNHGAQTRGQTQKYIRPVLYLLSFSNFPNVQVKKTNKHLFTHTQHYQHRWWKEGKERVRDVFFLLIRICN